MRKATRRVTQPYDDALAPARLCSTQYAILDQLDRQADPPPTMGELAETLVLDRSALGHNLRPLERDGLIALVAGDDDRRRRRVVLTTKGVAKLREGRRGWKLAQDRFNDVFGDLRMAAVDEVLDGKLARPVRGPSALRRPINYSRPHHADRRPAVALAGRNDGLIRR